MTDLQQRAAEAARDIREEAHLLGDEGQERRSDRLFVIAALITELAGQVPEWRPISEAPEYDGTRVLVTGGRFGVGMIDTVGMLVAGFGAGFFVAVVGFNP